MSYMTQATIADDNSMRMRIAACAAQEGCAAEGIDPDTWTWEWRRVWSAAPDWDDAWEYSLNVDPEATPGDDSSVITDGQILAQVQSMKPFTRLTS